jgi:hypothetical protein
MFKSEILYLILENRFEENQEKLSILYITIGETSKFSYTLYFTKSAYQNISKIWFPVFILGIIAKVRVNFPPSFV